MAEIMGKYIEILKEKRAAEAAATAATEEAYIVDKDYINGLVDKLNITDKYTKALLKETQAEQKRSAEFLLAKGDLFGAVAIRAKMLAEEHDLVEASLIKERDLKKEAASEEYTNTTERNAVLAELDTRYDTQIAANKKASEMELYQIANEYGKKDSDNTLEIAKAKIKIQQDYRDATKRILDDIAADVGKYANDLLTASNRIREAKAQELEDAGKIVKSL